ncbi:MAG: ribokinase [Clostridia bacterium]|nr:ribokinase [Clostridia bacterium]
MKILNFGSCNVDYVYSLDHIVAAGETEATQRMDTFAGGKGLNQSIAIARAGHAVCHVGCIGDGGEFLLALLKENGVDVSFTERVDVKNGHAIIQVSRTGENSIFLYPGSNEVISREQIDRALAACSKGDIVLLQNEINDPAYIVESAYRAGMTVMLNPSPINERIGHIDLHMVSYLVLNEIEAKEITKCQDAQGALSYFKEAFPKLKVMLTLGHKGCVYQDEHGQQFCPIYKVQTVDTTGAGDTFTGYFVEGIAAGRSMDVILKTASCAAAISVTRKGAAPSIPYMDEVTERIAR